jgi:hypothetical protein
MLGRFIVPAARLAEVSATAGELLAQGPPWTFSALGRGGETLEEFLNNLPADLDAIGAFRQRHPGRAVVDVFEVKLPAALSAGHWQDTWLDTWENRRSADRIHQPVSLTGPLGNALDATAGAGLQVYCEVPPGPRWHNVVDGVPLPQLRGLKLRCGGLEPAAFPSVEQLAYAISGDSACLAEDSRFKATAGLHHPLRHRDAGLNVMMHGFLNVFGAAVLAFWHALEEEQLWPILEDEDASHFVFDESGFRWQDWHMTAEQIQEAREQFAVSFGSCSFDEPREDLRSLGLLP